MPAHVSVSTLATGRSTRACLVVVLTSSGTTQARRFVGSAETAAHNSRARRTEAREWTMKKRKRNTSWACCLNVSDDDLVSPSGLGKGKGQGPSGRRRRRQPCRCCWCGDPEEELARATCGRSRVEHPARYNNDCDDYSESDEDDPRAHPISAPAFLYAQRIKRPHPRSSCAWGG